MGLPLSTAGRPHKIGWKYSQMLTDRLRGQPDHQLFCFFYASPENFSDFFVSETCSSRFGVGSTQNLLFSFGLSSSLFLSFPPCFCFFHYFHLIVFIISQLVVANLSLLPLNFHLGKKVFCRPTKYRNTAANWQNKIHLLRQFGINTTKRFTFHSAASPHFRTCNTLNLRKQELNKGIGDAGSTADFRMLWSAMVCLGLL